MYAAPFDWNALQTNLKLENLLTLDRFKSVIQRMEADQTLCNYF